MPQLVNPKLEIRVFGATTLFIKDLFVSFDITKDLEEEPNEARVTIFNMSEGSRGKLLASQGDPLEIHATSAGSTELVMCFRGEIDTVRNFPTYPGFTTELTCTSQQVNHRSKYIDKKEFAAGTPVGEIVNYFIGIIGLPLGQLDQITDEGIVLSQSFTGPAFKLMKNYVYDIGMHCYILDGKINVTDVYDPDKPTIKQIAVGKLLGAPEPTRRTDRALSRIITVAEVANQYKQQSARKKKNKKTRTQKLVGRSDYSDESTTDTLVEGMNFVFLLQADIQPDDLINVPTEGQEKQLWRVKEVDHFGENESFSEWTTEIETDLFEDVEAKYEGQIPKVSQEDAVTISNIETKKRFG